MTTAQLRNPLPDPPWFRVFQVDLDAGEEVMAVHAFADPGTLDVITEMAGPLWGAGDVAGRGVHHAQFRLPVAVMLHVWRQMDTMKGTDPRYRADVSNSLGRVYFGLISKDGE